MKRLIVLFLLFVLVFPVLTGCAGRPHNGEEEYDDTNTYVEPEEPPITTEVVEEEERVIDRRTDTVVTPDK